MIEDVCPLGGFSVVSPRRVKQRDHTEIAFIKQKLNGPIKFLRFVCCPVQLLESRLQRMTESRERIGGLSQLAAF